MSIQKAVSLVMVLLTGDCAEKGWTESLIQLLKMVFGYVYNCSKTCRSRWRMDIWLVQEGRWFFLVDTYRN